jgi:16S rRNA (guanine966-N2)-methyltransferase
MRIIAGEWRGRAITAPPGRAVRPTSDRAREAWMSIVHPHLTGARVLDLFAGTGALGLEALSRGAAHADFVEESARVVRVLQQNISTLGAGARATVHRGDAMRFVRRLARRTARGSALGGADAAAPPDGADAAVTHAGADAATVPGGYDDAAARHATPPFDIAFADPPWRTGLAAAIATLWIASPFAAIFGIEHETAHDLPDDPRRRETRRYGDTAVTFYQS